MLKKLLASTALLLTVFCSSYSSAQTVPNGCVALGRGAGVTGLLDGCTNIGKSKGTYFSDGYPWADPRAFGAKGDGTTDDAVAIQAAVTKLNSVGGGMLYVPPGIYCVGTTINIASTSVRVVGSAAFQASTLRTCGADVTVLNLNHPWSTIENIQVLGHGIEASGFGATKEAVLLGTACTSCKLDHDYIVGGYYPVKVTANDVRFQDTYAASGYGQAHVYAVGSVAGLRISGSSFDLSFPVSQPLAPISISARANATPYLAGDVVSLGGYNIQASVGGTSGGSPPTLKNYNQPITDGSVTWLLAGPTTLYGFQADTGTSEISISKTDITCPVCTVGVALSNNFAGQEPFLINIYSSYINSVLVSGIQALAGRDLYLNDNEFLGCFTAGCGAIALQNAYNGNTVINGNRIKDQTIGIYINAASAANTTISNNNIRTISNAGIVLQNGSNTVITGNVFPSSTNSDITVSNNVSNFTIASNSISKGITITGATNDYYAINDNIINSGATITDGGTGINKCTINNPGSSLNSCPNGVVPSISAGLCTSPSVTASNGAAAFDILVGSACGGSTGTITFPASTTGWTCNFANVTNPATNIVSQTGGNTTTVTITNYVRTTGVAGNFTAADHIRANCSPY